MAVANWYGYYLPVLAAESAFAAAAYDQHPQRLPTKRRKVEGQATMSTNTVETSAASTTRLFPFDGRRGRVTFKPYSDIRLDTTRSHHARECQQPLKRRHGDYLHAIPILNKNGSVVKNTHIIHPDRGCTIGNLFPEILSMIFEYLDVQSKGRVAQVSTRWRDAAYKKSVWKGMTASLHLSRSNPTLFPSLVKRGIKHVQVLSLRRSPRELVAGIPNLESLNLSGCYSLSDANLEQAFTKEVSSLTSLNLSLCKDVTDNSLGRIATNCKNLESVDLAGCTKITNAGILLLSWGLKKLKHLNLRSCRQISDQGIAHLCGIETPHPGSDSLESLSLQDCQKLTDESLRSISQGLPSLKSINLSFCVSITDTGLKSLAKMTSLEDINLRSCDNVSDIGIGFLAEEHQRLSRLDVSFCGNVSDASLRHMASGLAGSMRSLSMTTNAITDDGLIKLAKTMVKLQELHVGQCVKLSDLSLEAVASNMKELTLIDLYGCPMVTDSGLSLLKKNLPKLSKLNLSL